MNVNSLAHPTGFTIIQSLLMMILAIGAHSEVVVRHHNLKVDYGTTREGRSEFTLDGERAERANTMFHWSKTEFPHGRTIQGRHPFIPGVSSTIGVPRLSGLFCFELFEEEKTNVRARSWHLFSNGRRVLGFRTVPVVRISSR
jgi:hypothetical protein